MPVLVGSHTFSAAATATAASKALPPARRMRRPASEARVCEDATMPRVAIVGPRRPLNSIAVALSPHDFDPCPAMTASRCPVPALFH